MGTACDCDDTPRVEGCWRICPACHRWVNVHTGRVYECADFREVRPGT